MAFEPSISFVVKFALLPLILAVLAGEVVCAHGMKIATVDVGKIFSHWDFTIRFEDEIQGLRDSLGVKNDDRVLAIKKLIEKRAAMAKQYQELKPTLSEEERSRMDSAYKKLGLELEALEQDRTDFLTRENRKISDLQSRSSKFILERIEATINAYAAEHHYDMVIEMEGKTTRNLPFFLHLEGAADITGDIITQLNASGGELPLK